MPHHHDHLYSHHHPSTPLPIPPASASITISTKLSQAESQSQRNCNPAALSMPTPHTLSSLPPPLHLSHFLPQIHIYFGISALHESSTCSIPLPLASPTFYPYSTLFLCAIHLSSLETSARASLSPFPQSQSLVFL